MISAHIILPHFDKMPSWAPMMLPLLRSRLKNNEFALGIDEDTALIGKPGADWHVQGRLKVPSDRYYASPVAGDGKIFIASEKGKVIVLPPGGGLEPIAVNDLQDDIYATPALMDGHIYVRTRNSLYCFGK